MHYHSISLISSIVFNYLSNRKDNNGHISHKEVNYITSNMMNDRINNVRQRDSSSCNTTNTMNNETAYLSTLMNDEVSTTSEYQSNHFTSFNQNKPCRQSSSSPNVGRRSTMNIHNEYINKQPQSSTSCR